MDIADTSNAQEAPVKLPEPKLPPLKIVKSGFNYCLCTFKNKWVNGRSVCVKGSTKTRGVVVKQQKTGRIKWKEDFLMEHPELRKFDAYREEAEGNEKRKKKAYKIRFEQRDSEEPDEVDQITVSLRSALEMKSYKAGATWVLGHIIKDTPLDIALSHTFGGYSRDLKLKSLAMYMYLAGSMSMDRYSEFAKSYRMPYKKPLDGGQCSRLFSSIQEKDIQVFLNKLNTEALKLEEEDTEQEHVYYALDSSSISTYSKSLGKAQFGYNKDGDDLRQVNIMMLVNQKTGLPIYYREYDGDVPDVSTVSTMLKEYARLELNRQGIIVADRGYGTPLNVHRFFQTDTSFLLNFRTSFSFCKNLIAQHYNELNDVLNYDAAIESYVFTTKVMWSYPVNYKTNCKERTPREKKPMYVHMFFNEDIKNEAKKQFIKQISKILKKLANGDALEKDEEVSRDKYLIAKEGPEPGEIKYVLDTSKMAEFLMNKGVQILISDTVSSAAEARAAYDMRNSVELAFGMLKQQVGGRRLHISTEPTLRGKVFTLFLAVAIGLMFRCRRQHSKQDEHMRAKSDHQMLDVLNNIEAKIWDQGLYYTEITGLKKKILDVLEVPLPEKEVFTKDELDKEAAVTSAIEDLTEEEARKRILEEMAKG